MKQLLVATLNTGKVREISAALAPTGIEVCGLDSLVDLPEIEETGTTFEENARLKAEGYSRLTELFVLADDSGLEVDALGGAPGVQSARYGGPGLDGRGRNRKLLAALDGVEPERRTAGGFWTSRVGRTASATTRCSFTRHRDARRPS
jgi:XTP/dITP diphosphohydrolase